VVLAVRDPSRGQEALAQLTAAAPGAKATLEPLDLSSLASVRAFAKRMVDGGKPLDLLINNAGVMALPTRELTDDGFERQLATNHLGHFALTGLVLPLLKAAPAPRVVTVSSSVTLWARFDLGNLQSEQRYTPMGAYGQSKLCNLYFMLELHRRAPAGLISVASHPGGTATNLQKYQYRLAMKLFGQHASMGALPSLYAAVGDDVRGGTYYGPRHWFGMSGPPALAKLPKRALDETAAQKLWTRSEELTAVRFALEPPAAASARHAG
jgi:NAD(P)-dependent dehydrogenase (short-subunit alcohol dehydrogenase family)